MELSGSLSAYGRRAVAVFGVAAILSAAPALARQDPGQQAAAPAQQEDPLKFNVDTPILLINQVRATAAADFEASWATIKSMLAKSAKPEVQAFGRTLDKFYKVDLPAAGSVFYVFQLDQPSRTHSYNPVEILFTTLMGEELITREEADTLYEKLKAGYENINPWPLRKIG